MDIAQLIPLITHTAHILNQGWLWICFTLLFVGVLTVWQLIVIVEKLQRIADRLK